MGEEKLKGFHNPKWIIELRKKQAEDRGKQQEEQDEVIENFEDQEQEERLQPEE